MSKSVRSGGANDGQERICDGRVRSSGALSTTTSTTRRNVLRIGAGLAAVSGLPSGLGSPAIAQLTLNVPKAPNIIVLMTDEERHHSHWPDGWAEKNLPSLQ